MSKTANDIKINCLKKWSYGSDLDERLIKFDVSFEEWLNQIPEK